MMSLNSKHGDVVIYAETIENETIAQITKMANSDLGQNAHIRIMPDAHAGTGCVIGTTMTITDKICPNIVGVDIGCGVDLIRTDVNFEKYLPQVDEFIHKHIPHGMEIHDHEIAFPFETLYAWEHLSKEVKLRAKQSMGTLGGGNHFIEIYENGNISVHSGSRNIGAAVARYYQDMAEKDIKNHNRKLIREDLQKIEPKLRETWLRQQHIKIDSELCYLTGEHMQAYLHDIEIIQDFAVKNRQKILRDIIDKFNGIAISKITSTHNYIDTKNMILRKGAISAQKDEMLVIPMNMRDGILICKGKGNPEWNYSAPHGAGRLYSRARAKEIFNLEQYQDSMKNIFTTCVNENTLDEAPFVYKNQDEIKNAIAPTVEIIEQLKPVYNFKAN